MTPTDKDAMALAVLDKAAKQVSDWHPHGSEYQDEQATERFREKVIEARAHLASRIAEDAGEIYRLNVCLIEETNRAGRAEAELAAVLNFLRDDSLALGQYRTAAIKAARGGE